MKNFDFVIVGAGLFGAVVAERMATAGRRVLIIEKRDHIGGNCWSETDKESGVEVHKYGSHIFHTSFEDVWKYLNRFTTFNEYRHSVWTQYRDKPYSMPINLGTINSYYGLNLRPEEVEHFLKDEIGKEQYSQPQNLEEQAISLVGRPLYEAFIRGYTIKQWGKDPRELPAEIIKRLPVRNNYNNRYFNDRYEGIPTDGYGAMFERILDHPNIAIELSTDWFTVRDQYLDKVPIIYTGPIDAFFDFEHGRLEWRSIEFEKEVHDVPDYQGCTVMNYADAETPFTRIHEFKHFHPERTQGSKTIIFREFSNIVSEDSDPFYPVNTPRNTMLLKKYSLLAEQYKSVYFGGRLGSYRYIDMDDTVKAGLELAATMI